MKMVILISFTLGFLGGFRNDKAKQDFYGKLTLSEHIIVPSVTIVVVYFFFQSINFGFMAILQILLGSYMGGQLNKFIKKILKRDLL